MPLPSYTVRVSKRARRIILRVVPGKGLEVVLPFGCPTSAAEASVARNREWVERTLARVPGASTPGIPEVPEYFTLKGNSECITIHWRGETEEKPAEEASLPQSRGEKNVEKRTLTLPHRGSAVFLAHEERLELLREWVRTEAKRWLEPLLAETALAHGFSYSAMRVRFQKSRWGSCSARKSISLNACLVFLPEDLVRYILLHELCHTREMNHSDAFWRLVFKADPEALAKDKAMRGAWRYVPEWLAALM